MIVDATRSEQVEENAGALCTGRDIHAATLDQIAGILG